MPLKPAVEVAIGELQESFPTASVSCKDDTDGGAIVTIEGVPLNSNTFVQSETWVGFHITFQYPDADVYPHHVRHDLARKDGRALIGDGLHPNNSYGKRTSLMLSRRTKRRDVSGDTASTKLRRVLAWLEQCPETEIST